MEKRWRKDATPLDPSRSRGLKIDATRPPRPATYELFAAISSAQQIIVLE